MRTGVHASGWTLPARMPGRWWARRAGLAVAVPLVGWSPLVERLVWPVHVVGPSSGLLWLVLLSVVSTVVGLLSLVPAVDWSRQWRRSVRDGQRTDPGRLLDRRGRTLVVEVATRVVVVRAAVARPLRGLHRGDAVTLLRSPVAPDVGGLGLPGGAVVPARSRLTAAR